MSRPDAFSACYADWKLVKSRKVVQIVLEVPMETSDAAYQLLGGMPNPAAEIWVGVAKLAKKPEHEQKGHRRWADLTVGEQAGIRCNEDDFQRFVEASNASGAAVALRERFNVASRKDIPRDQWEAFETEYQLWQRASL